MAVDASNACRHRAEDEEVACILPQEMLGAKNDTGEDDEYMLYVCVKELWQEIRERCAWRGRGD